MPDPSDPDLGIATTQTGDDATEAPSLESTEVDPFATVLPTETDDPSVVAGSVDSTLEDSYATRFSAVSDDGFTAVSQVTSQGSLSSIEQVRFGGKAALPRFRPVRLHARGGLGEVYLAVDSELNREVALKEIQERHVDRFETQTRFVFEAEVTGGLEHPGIVPVYGLGRYPDGRPYYAMRFIRGDSLKTAIRKFHESAAAHPSTSTSIRYSLEFRQLLTRFVAVCHAIDYAHSRGVLHRDIKPDNIMLGPHGETLVVDWGLAKALNRPDPPDDSLPKPLRPMSGSDTSATIVGSVMGTPPYMSPEQAAGEVESLGPASDIFSLGSTLYALLTGLAPFREKGLTELLEHVRKAEFPPPRSLNKSIPPALEAICLKAMSRYPGNRYPTAAALATDIERWLADEPVLAYPEPWTIRLARWARRHRTAVAASFALLLTASLALGISTVLIGREKDKAEKNHRLARSAVEKMLTEVGEVDLANVPQMESVRRDLLKRAVEFYQEFISQRGIRSSWRLEAGRALGRLGEIEVMLGHYVQAESNYREALKLLDSPAAEVETRRAMARARFHLGIMLKKSNRFAESESFLREALLERRALAKQDPKNDDDAKAVSSTLYQLGTLLARLKDRSKEDEAFYRQAIQDQEDLVAKPTNTGENRLQLARFLNNLGTLQSGSDPASAKATFLRAQEIQKDLEADWGNNPGFHWQRARTWNNLANLDFGFGQYDNAESEFVAAEIEYLRLAAAFPNVPDYRRELALVVNNHAQFLERHPYGKEQPADSFRRAIEVQRKLVAELPEVPDNKMRLAISLYHLGALLAFTAQPGAESSLDEAIKLQEQLVAEYPQVPEYQAALGRTQTERALLLSRLGKSPEALGLLDKAIKTLEQARAGNPRDQTYARFLIDAHGDRAEALLKLGRHADATLEASQVAKVDPRRSEGFLLAAGFMSRCFELAGSDASLDDSKRREVQEDYARKAIQAVRDAIDQGAKDPSILDGPDFKPLKGRPDFEKVRQDWKAKGQKATV